VIAMPTLGSRADDTCSVPRQAVNVTAYGIADASINYALTSNLTLFAQG
jgi:hypothetical protein